MVEYSKAVKIGKQRAEQAARALALLSGEKAMPLFRLQTSKDMEPHDVQPVGQENLKDIAIRQRPDGEMAWLLVVDRNGTVKASTHAEYPVSVAIEKAMQLSLPLYIGRGAVLAEILASGQYDSSSEVLRRWKK